MDEIESAESQSDIETSETESATDQSTGTQQTTVSGSDEQTFFDPASIQGKPELELAYKQMQRDYVKKTQAIADQRRKIEAYESFEADPMGTIQALATQYGYTLNRPGEQQQQPTESDPYEQEMISAAVLKAKQEVFKQLSPLINKVESMNTKNIETYLDNNHSDWRTYEDQMIAIVKKHPTLADEPDLLYDMAIPRKVREARATQAALAKIKADSGAAQISGGSSTSKKVTDKPKKMSFQDAYQYAKRQLANG